MVFKLFDRIFQPSEFVVVPYMFDMDKCLLTTRGSKGTEVLTLKCTIMYFEHLLSTLPLDLTDLVYDVPSEERAAITACTYMKDLDDVSLAQFVNKYPQHFNQILSHELPVDVLTYVVLPFFKERNIGPNSQCVETILDFINWYAVASNKIPEDFSSVETYVRMGDYASLYHCGTQMLQAIMSGNTSKTMAPIIE